MPIHRGMAYASNPSQNNLMNNAGYKQCPENSEHRLCNIPF